MHRRLNNRTLAISGVALLIVILVGGWWWSNRPMETVFMEGSIVITAPNHFVMLGDGSCKGTRDGYLKNAEVQIELASGELETFILEPGVVDSGTCVLAFSGDVPVSDTYTAHVDQFRHGTLDRRSNQLLVGTGETDENFVRLKFIADPYDPWAND